MIKQFHSLGYTIIAIGALAYMMGGLGPPISGLAMLFTFVGSAIALHGSHRIDYHNPYRLKVILDMIRVGGLTVLCLALLALGKMEAARTPLMFLAVILVTIFLVQIVLQKNSDSGDTK